MCAGRVSVGVLARWEEGVRVLRRECETVTEGLEGEGWEEVLSRGEGKGVFRGKCLRGRGGGEVEGGGPAWLRRRGEGGGGG